LGSAECVAEIVFSSEVACHLGARLRALTQDEDRMWIAECPSIPGCVSQGQSRTEAIENIRETIAACLEVQADRGMPLTVETEQVEVTI
jgi:predicted RNase H-like HicB family nuclease